MKNDIIFLFFPSVKKETVIAEKIEIAGNKYKPYARDPKGSGIQRNLAARVDDDHIEEAGEQGVVEPARPVIDTAASKTRGAMEPRHVYQPSR